MSVRNAVALLCIAAIALAAWTGCAPEKAAPKQATVTWWAPNFNLTRPAEMAAKFMKDNPNIKIEIQETVAQGLPDKIQVALQSGTTPDIIEGQIAWTAPNAMLGGLAPLDDYIAKSKVVDPKDYMPGAWNGVQVGGKVYGIPYRAESHAFIYNKAMYKAAGLDPNTPPKTWKDLLDNAKKLTKAGGAKPVYGYAICGGGEVGNMITILVGWIWSNGGDVLSPDLKKVTINEPAAVEAVKFYTDLLTVHKVVPPSTLQNAGNEMRNLFIQETVAQFQQGAYAIPTIHKENSKIELGFGLIPFPEGKKPASTLGGWAFTMPKAAKSKDAAWSFMEYMAQADNMAFYTDTFPATFSALKNARFNNPELKAFIEMAPYARLYPPVKSWVQMMNIIFKEVQGIMLGQKTPQKAMDDAAAAMTPLL